MPTVFIDLGYRFFFYSNEGSPLEPVHVHIEKGDGEAKLWMSPMRFAYADGFNGKEQAEILELAEKRRKAIGRAWRDHFGQ